MNRFVKKMIFGCLVGYSGSFCVDVQSDAMPLVLNSGQAVSAYKKVLDSSMRLWGYLSLHNKCIYCYDYRPIDELIAECLGDLTLHVSALLAEYQDGLPFLIEDIEYLMDIFSDIEFLHEKFCEHARKGCSKEVNLSTVKMQLKALLDDSSLL